jgi:polyhydroxybutyrate depolymerase
MSFRLACDAADLFAAVAPVTATMPADLGPRCQPSAPVAVLGINGTADPLVPYAGGHVRTLFGLRGEIWSTDRTIAFWAKRNACAGPPDVRALADRDSDDGSRVVDITYARCAGARVRLLRVEGGGHTWPGGTQYLPTAWIGPTNRDIDASEAIWRFFAASVR